MKGVNNKNLTNMTKKSCTTYMGLIDATFSYCVVSFGNGGGVVFQGSQSSVTMQLNQNHCLFLMGMHCMAHCTKLVVTTLYDA